MARALELAAQGQGLVEPNPMVGCTIVRDGETVGEGFHRRYGGPHAEIEALQVAGKRAAGATAYVTLEPCCHHGKTPPCSEALIAAGLRRVVVAQRDPFPQVDGGGIQALEAAGIDVDVGLQEELARELNAPYLKLVGRGRPWVIAKWAMTLDGKLATHAGDSRWISCEASRAAVHRLRGRVDAIVVGRGTAEADDPLLTVRPPGARTPARIVLDSRGSLAAESQLVRTAGDAPVIVAVADSAPGDARDKLAAAGCEVLACAGASHAERLEALLDELGRRRMTNVLVEGGSTLLGALFDAGAIDEVHAFIAPKLAGGQGAPSPVGGQGVDLMAQAVSLIRPVIELSGDDVYIHGRIARQQAR
ncbi:MAG: bifunctional diaminohydroxyphosphoribosylaminopyrimidine deaminase/5-amino-6-(5-phosphoribosylamino)uracil reductase RibD [Planctomycetota bacterium]|nr:MAG: bifunctional diaminohydroxyphosphoribosylaminopyrimidine deaminase/5-amino-6-(5-phosphoribosylamino)uracil reductase RibD [Planctomycetota bacterium]